MIINQQWVKAQQSADDSKSQWAGEDLVGEGIGGSWGRWWSREGGSEAHPINEASEETRQR
jgi:hypothetical protein